MKWKTVFGVWCILAVALAFSLWPKQRAEPTPQEVQVMLASLGAPAPVKRDCCDDLAGIYWWSLHHIATEQAKYDTDCTPTEGKICIGGIPLNHAADMIEAWGDSMRAKAAADYNYFTNMCEDCPTLGELEPPVTSPPTEWDDPWDEEPAPWFYEPSDPWPGMSCPEQMWGDWAHRHQALLDCLSSCLMSPCFTDCLGNHYIDLEEGWEALGVCYEDETPDHEHPEIVWPQPSPWVPAPIYDPVPATIPLIVEPTFHIHWEASWYDPHDTQSSGVSAGTFSWNASSIQRWHFTSGTMTFTECVEPE